MFFLQHGGTRFGMRDQDGGNEVAFNLDADGTYSANGTSVNSASEAVDAAFQNAFFAGTPHEVFLLTYAVVKDGFVDAKNRSNPDCVISGSASRSGVWKSDSGDGSASNITELTAKR